jgi:hypothetical protein
MKVNQLEEALYHTQESMRKNDEIVSATLLEFQKRLEVTEYRARTNEKELEGVTNVISRVKLVESLGASCVTSTTNLGA